MKTFMRAEDARPVYARIWKGQALFLSYIKKNPDLQVVGVVLKKSVSGPDHIYEFICKTQERGIRLRPRPDQLSFFEEKSPINTFKCSRCDLYFMEKKGKMAHVRSCHKDFVCPAGYCCSRGSKLHPERFAASCAADLKRHTDVCCPDLT